MTGVLRGRANIDTEYTKGRPCEDIGRRWPSSQGERPQKNPTLPITLILDF